MMNLFKMTIGDWSNDGHGRTECFLISCEVDYQTLVSTYSESCKKTGIVFHEVVARGYEDDSYPVERFRELGCSEELLHDFVEDPEHYFGLFRWFCSLSSPGILIERKETQDLAHGISGQFGYGLFCG